MELIDPTTGAACGRAPESTWDEAAERIERAASTFASWSVVPIAERAERVRAVGAVLRRRTGELALLMAEEMGKPITQGRQEVEKCAWACDHFSEHGPGILAPRMVATEAKRSWVSFQPLGPILAVMPWNFPFWQLFRFAAPTLVAGNTVVLKHASNVPRCALAIEECFAQADFPPGAVVNVLANVGIVPQMIAHPLIAAVTLTGSVAAGRAVAAVAGTHLKKTVLELGGSDAYVVLDDADIDSAAAVCAQSRLINCGQSCIAAKRFVVDRTRVDEFERALAARMCVTVVGDPREERTELGPLARVDQRDALHRQVQASIDAGARVVLGGTVPDRAGAWYPPTILSDVAPGMPAYGEELFGPVAAIIPAQDEDDAVRIANDTPFGLGAAVFTRDAQRGARLAETRLVAGACAVNALVRSDPRLPFGGVRDSGYGRELGEQGILELVNVKSMWVG